MIAGLLLITPIYKYIIQPGNSVYAWGLAVTVAGFTAAVVIYLMLRRGRYTPWMGFVSSSLDISLISMALALFIYVAGPLAALNSKVTFEVYFLAIAATALRYDGRICAVGGGLALAQYGALWGWSAANHDLGSLPIGGEGTYVVADQVTRLILLGSAAVLAMLLVSRAQVLQTAASTDPLTGVGNRIHFDRRTHAELERARRYKRQLAIALVDVDHFKQFNDVHGHPVGDSVLVTVASLLNRNLRRSDVLARYGGEEFALVLPEADIHSAAAKVDIIRRTIGSTPLDIPGGKEPNRLTISAGIAVFPRDGDSVDLLIATADERLLLAKRQGRDRVVTTSDGVEEPS